MKDNRLYFRTRGGPTQGWGNVIRMASFAEYCRKRGWTNIVFFVEGPTEVICFLQSKGFVTVTVTEDIYIEDEAEMMRHHPRAKFCFIEMLECSYARQKMYKMFAEKVIVFDDLLDHRYCADCVVCGQLLPSYGNKDISDKDTVFKIGLEYFLSRPEYEKYYSRKRFISKELQKVVVAFGGGDYAVAYLKTAMALQMFSDDIAPTFILGYVKQEKLHDEIRRLLPHAEICGGVDNLDEYFFDADFAIIGAGYNKMEAAITKTPSLLISVQWHQIPLAEQFEKVTGMPYLGYMSYVSVHDIIAALEKYSPLTEREKISRNSADLIDGKGFERIYTAILSND